MAKLSRELKALGKDIIDLSLGEPDFDTPLFILPAKRKNQIPISFDTLRRGRRGQLLEAVHDGLAEALDPRLVDRLGHIPELALYECFACDGHWHRAATHDPRHDGTKMAVGHFYSLNLRRQSLRHLATAEGLHEHDMNALKRAKPHGLRQGVVRGRGVLTVSDKAGIDFRFWKRCRQECAVYFLSLVKEDMVYDWLNDRDWDREDPRHHGVQSDRRVMTREGVELRIVVYLNPVDGERFEFLTNEPDLPPGVIAELYRRRWEIEKVFDEIKNKLCERKAWGTSLETRTAQARLIAITHNLLLAYEQHLERERDIQNRPEDRRRTQQTSEARKQALQAGRPLSTLVCASRRATQCCVKFIWWLPRNPARPPHGRRRRGPPSSPICLPVIPLHAHRSGCLM